MRAYVRVTGAVFALLVVAHLWRLTEERHLARDPFFLGTTLVALSLSAWAMIALRRASAGSR